MNFRKTSRLSVTISLVSIFFMALVCYAAYNHKGDLDSAVFRETYPNTVGTKLDSCNTCHRSSDKKQGDPVTYGSCQWCHYVTNYGADLSEATLLRTLNAYGLAYKGHGRSVAALLAIKDIDSDVDDFTNQAEIVALTYPGDAKDDPTKVPAPSRVISLKELEDMPLHSQFLLMNASKSDDSYTKYGGIALENLIKAVMLDSATGTTVYSPDGFATKHPFDPTTNSNDYHVFGIYPPGTFYYDARADIALYPPDAPGYATGGWCNYSSPSAAVCGHAGPGRHRKGHTLYSGHTGHRHDHCACRENESAIFNPEGLKMLLAFKRDGEYLTPGVLNLQNKLDGEGPFRVVPPQKTPGWPDQRSSSTNQSVIWPYDESADHNAGFSSRTVTMIKVEPLPAGTTDINTLEAGWPYVDEKKIVIYGSIDPYPVHNLNRSLDALIDAIMSQKGSVFRNKSYQKALVNKVETIKKQVAHGAYSGALARLKEDVLEKTDGCLSGTVDWNDWIKDLVVQQQLCSEIQKIWVMLVVLGG